MNSKTAQLHNLPFGNIFPAFVIEKCKYPASPHAWQSNVVMVGLSDRTFSIFFKKTIDVSVMFSLLDQTVQKCV